MRCEPLPLRRPAAAPHALHAVPFEIFQVALKKPKTRCSTVTRPLSLRGAVTGEMSARRTQRAFTLDDEDDDVSYIPGISTAASDAVTSPRSPAKGGVGAQAAQIGAGALSRTTTAAERIQGRFRTWM